MKYQKFENKIEIYQSEEFCPAHILECGQVFCYKKVGGDYFVYPKNKLCKVSQSGDKYIIETDDVDFFEEYFDLKTDYAKIKKDLASFEELSFPLEFGGGIRILKQDLLETIISFMISANNNIKRITGTLDKIRAHFNKKIKNNFGVEFYAFPSLEELKTLDEEFFKSVGAGYRAPYLVETISKLDEFLKCYSIDACKLLPTKEILVELLKLKGIGRKVAECVLLFAYGRHDVFPVDTWIKKVYADMFNINEKTDPSKICDELIGRYGMLSGYAQQYLFYSKRENKHI